jgi:ABC-type uncharacterized transport system permease subunit
MAGYAVSYDERLGLARGARRRAVRAASSAPLHGYICKLPKVNDIAIGIALMLFGTGLAFFLGKPYIQPSAPRLPSISLGGGATIRRSLRRSRSIRCSSSASRSPWACGGRSRTRAGA